jgi:hypothetical protein
MAANTAMKTTTRKTNPDTGQTTKPPFSSTRFHKQDSELARMVIFLTDDRHDR